MRRSLTKQKRVQSLKLLKTYVVLTKFYWKLVWVHQFSHNRLELSGLQHCVVIVLFSLCLVLLLN